MGSHGGLKRCYGKILEKTRKNPKQNCPPNYTEKKVIFEEKSKFFRVPVFIRTFLFNYIWNSVE
jgi:hypothetical protein